MYGEAASSNKIRVLILDSSPIHTELLAEALRRDHALEVARSDSATSMIRTALESAVDVLVISATLDEQRDRGLEILRELRSCRPHIRAVVLLDSSKSEVVLDAFRAGARGVFSRFDSVERLCQCVRCVHTGQIWADSRQMALALEALASAPALHSADANGLALLSKREREIVQSLAKGLTNREIAATLKLSQHTVKNYLFRIFDKLGVSSRIELLFMILNHESNPHSAFRGFLKTCTEGTRHDESMMQECQQAAEQGSPVAQLVLAHMYWVRKNSAADIVLAYHWYLIASAQISQASTSLKNTMSMEQLLQAENTAADWLRRNRRVPPASVSAATRLRAVRMVGSD